MNLENIKITPLSRIPTVGGDVLHGLKNTDTGFTKFGEAYFSWVSEGAVKAWKRHKKMTMNIVVPVGMARFVFFSEDENKFRVEEIGVDRYSRLTIPANIWFGFMGVSPKQSLVLNIADILHDPQEVERLDQGKIYYDWV